MSDLYKILLLVIIHTYYILYRIFNKLRSVDLRPDELIAEKEKSKIY